MVTIKAILNQAEFTVYQNALKQSDFQTILNEKEILETELLDLPKSIRGTILPEDARLLREHPDTRLARRAQTIVNLAKVISERKVKIGIRRTLLGQAKRLDRLAQFRIQQIEGKRDDEEQKDGKNSERETDGFTLSAD